MKILISLLALVFLVKDCKSNSTSQEHSNYQKEITITYTANTRGFYEHITITKEAVNFSKDRDLKNVTTKPCPKKDWDELMSLIRNIDISKLNTLTPPSKKFQFDGAPMATFQLNLKEQEVKTPIFDHGNPPKTIAEIVTKVLALKDKVLQN